MFEEEPSKQGLGTLGTVRDVAADALLARRVLRWSSSLFPFRYAPLLLLVLACAVPAAGCSLVAGEGSSGASGGYGNVIQFDGVRYEENGFEGDANPEATGAEPAQVFARVKAQLQGRNSTREIRNGDAGLLPKGTPVHAVRGYDPSYRLTARMPSGRWVLYEAVEGLEAERGADLLDIGGKVSRVEVGPSMVASAEADGVGRMVVAEDAREVQEFVGAALGAPVWRKPDPLAGDHQIVFYLKDGTATGGAYASNSGKLSTTPGGSVMGITLPTRARDTIERALRG